MTKQIPLTQGQVALVDDWHYDELSQWKWHAQWQESTQSYCAVRLSGWPIRRSIMMHRQIMNTSQEMECDHRNHDTLDNQEHNLRNVTHSQNQMNKRIYSNNRLGEKCIGRDGNAFRVRVKKDGKVVFSKSFRALDDAIAARDTAINQFHGEYSHKG